MITIFTAPKPFRGHIGIIQRNAIQSWIKLGQMCKIVLIGDDDGIAETAFEFNLTYIPDIKKNKFGTPLINSIFSTAEKISTSSMLCYINTDIILLKDFIIAANRLNLRKFLMIGQRWDMNISYALDFTSPNWEIDLKKNVSKFGILHSIYGIDYFLFSKGLWENIPPFALGRTIWDNWLVCDARSKGAAVINATDVVIAVHQNHNYDGSKKEIFTGPEAIQNGKMAGIKGLSILDSNYILTPDKLKHALNINYIKRLPGRWLRLHPKIGNLFLK